MNALNRNKIRLLVSNRMPAATCAADFNGDGQVNVIDLLLLIGDWG
ncbi:MAG: dockerin type I domain-containing protein [Phycisphaerales bacterium]|nr:dockerin type I domain-containing protein [Phycisphaerales bacterium]MCI0675083.1 dockerin type I domain-containing protein [Phycisphaerales bacterium]